MTATKRLTDEERADLQEMRREAVENLARIDRLLASDWEGTRRTDAWPWLRLGPSPRQ